MEITLPIEVFIAHPSDKDTDKVIKVLNKVSPPVKINIFPSLKYQEFFPDAIRKSIENSDILLAILNENGREKQWVNQEVGIAVAKDIQILILAEKDAKLKGFVNRMNKDIIDIESSELDEKLLDWLYNYQERNKLKILERLIIDDLKKLRRIISARRHLCQDNKELASGIDNILKNLEDFIVKAFEIHEEREYILISTLSLLKRGIEKVAKYRNVENPIANQINKDFEKIMDNSDLIPNINRYIEAREKEIWENV